MKPRKIAILALAASSLAGCGNETDWVKEQVGHPLTVVIDPAVVEQIRSDASAKGYTVEGSLLSQSMTETLRLPGRLRWFGTLMQDDGSLLYVGTKSVKPAADGEPIETDFIFRRPARGMLDIHMTMERRDRIWEPRPGTYTVTDEPPDTVLTGKKDKEKHAK